MNYFSSSSPSLSDTSCIATWEENVSADGSVFYVQYFKEKPNINSKNSLKCNKKANHNCKCRSLKSLRKKKERELAFLNCQHCETNKMSICEISSGEEVEIHFFINPKNRSFGEETLCESLLGFSTQPLCDGIRLKVGKCRMSSLLYPKKCAKSGDWFKSINEFEINSLNIDTVLLQFTKPSIVCLKFERTLKNNNSFAKSKIIQIPNFKTFVKLSHNSYESITDKNEQDITFSVIIVPITFCGDESITNNATFCYPEQKTNNLFNIRGSFLTLFSILKTELAVEPIHTKVYIGNFDYFVSYVCHGNVLLLISISSKHLTYKEIQLKILDIVQYFKSFYHIFDKDIDSDINALLYESCRIIDIYLKTVKNIYLFEEILQQSHTVNLPKKTQREIYETLNELGAMDYRDWNDTPLNAHREFFICGCVLYYQSYLLNNQLSPTHLNKVESFLRCSGVFDFIKNQTVNDFICWKEIPLENINRRNFLLIYTRNHLTLAVLLQEHDSEGLLNKNLIYEAKIRRPPLFYIEEIQETLDHLRRGGIEYLANVWTETPDIYSDIYGTFLSGEICLQSTLGEIAFLKNSSEDVSMVRKTSFSNVESDTDWDGFSNSYKCGKGSSGAHKTNIAKEISDTIPTSVCVGDKSVLIHYVQINFGTGLVIAPPNDLSGILVQEFKSACQLIHTVFEKMKRNSLTQNKISSNSCGSLTIVTEHAIRIYVPDSNGFKKQFWAIGKLFMSPISELYVCNKELLSLDETAFRISFLTSG